MFSCLAHDDFAFVFVALADFVFRQPTATVSSTDRKYLYYFHISLNHIVCSQTY